MLNVTHSPMVRFRKWFNGPFSLRDKGITFLETSGTTQLASHVPENVNPQKQDCEVF